MNESIKILRHESTIRRALWPPILGMGILALILLLLVWRLLDTAQWVEHSDRVLNLANRTLRLAIDMETGKRGFLLAGDEELLAPYKNASGSIDEIFDRWQAEVVDNPQQVTHVKKVREAFEAWHQEADEEIATYHHAPPQSFYHPFDDRKGKQKMDAVRAAVDAFVKEESTLRDQRTRSVTTATRWSLWGGAGITLLAGGILAWTTRRQMHTLSDQYETLIETEQRVRERLATTLTSIGDGVLVTDSRGHITLMNPVTEMLTGWTQEEAQGKDSKIIFDIAHEETGEPVISPVEQAIQENRTVLLANHTVLKRRDGTMIAIEDSAAPVRNPDGSISGVVLVFRDVTERKQHELELAAAMAKTERIAETLQRSMLMTLSADTFPGLQLATLYEPASDEALVGGDFYDAFAFWDDRVALVIGDATGKGLNAAATTSEVKYALRAYLHEDDHPGIAMTRLNRFLASDKRRGGTFGTQEEGGLSPEPMAFISMAIAVVNTTTGEGRCAVAGAEPPLLLTESGQAIETGKSGMMLGAIPEMEYEVTDFTLGPGDLLGFVTDGITEARRGRRDFFGYEGFIRAMKRAAGKAEQDAATERPTPSLDHIAASIVAEARDHAGGSLQDDVCLLIAQRS